MPHGRGFFQPHMLYSKVLPFASFMLASAAATSIAAAADMAAAKAKADACAPCHGPAGISQVDGIPSLAGQPDAFIQWQLVYFRAGTRKSDIMGPIAAGTSNEDIRALGAYFAALPPPAKPAQDGQPGMSKAGAEAAARHGCGTCHLKNFAGDKIVARLADQREEYLLKSLRDFKSGSRTGGGVASMPDIMYSVTDDEMKALAHFLANLP